MALEPISIAANFKLKRVLVWKNREGKYTEKVAILCGNERNPIARIIAITSFLSYSNPEAFKKYGFIQTFLWR